MLGSLALVFAHPWLALAIVLGMLALLLFGVLWLLRRLARALRASGRAAAPS